MCINFFPVCVNLAYTLVGPASIFLDISLTSILELFIHWFL